ncbi:MAG TPA: hypothetical protein VKY24_22940 [Reyranella sp.]|jgi:hypothetical protein|nr:hypothetical protein [Reyranella sp.]
MRPLLFALLLAALSPATAFAQSAADLAYCNRLADLYDRYLGQADYGSERGYAPGSLDSQVASAQCRAGNPAGIPVLERLLRNNGFSLPPRG